MQGASIVLSIRALLLSLFTFWWSNLREKRALYFVRVHKLEPFEAIAFALVNGGKGDVLVTSILLAFEGAQKGSRYYPAIKVDGGEDGKADLITAGKAVEFRISFLEEFTPTFAAQGRQAWPWPHLHSHVATVELAWIDASGRDYSAKVFHTRFGFEPSGKLRAIAPFNKPNERYELFAVAT